MAFQRPTLAEIIERSQADFVSRLELTGAVLRRSLVYVLSRVVAGASHMMHGHLDFLARQLFPDSAEDEFLERQAALFGLSKNAPAFAKGTVTLTGTNGTPVSAGTVLIRSDGAEYTTDADATIASGTATPSVTAALAGADGTLTVGLVLSFESPVAGVDSTATVASSTQDGSDQETSDGLRARLLARMSDPPHGGTVADYVEWAKEVTGVTRVWVIPRGLGPGTVLAYFVRDGDESSIIPDSGEVAAVQAKFDAEAPAHCTPTAAAPVASPLNISLDITPDTDATRAAVIAELTDLLLRTAAPGSTVLLSQIRTAIGTADGVTDYFMTTPVGDVTHAANQLPTLGDVTFNP